MIKLNENEVRQYLSSLKLAKPYPRQQIEAAINCVTYYTYFVTFESKQDALQQTRFEFEWYVEHGGV
jgi:hypothetical protein